MGIPRHNAASIGWMVAQFFDKHFKGASYDYSNRPINLAGRHTVVIDADGIPAHRQAPGTAGPIGGWLLAPGKGGSGKRSLGQWAQVFPAQIYDVTAGVASAGVIHDITDGTVTFDDGLGGIVVVNVDGTTPTLSAFGLIVAGSDLGSQQAIFFEGGGGTSSIPAKLTGTASGSGNYNWVEVDPTDNTTLSGGRSGTAYELNRSTGLPVDGSAIVEIDTFVGGGSAGPPVVAPTPGFYFFYPLGACLP